MQHVYTGRDELDAHFVKGLLLEEGIVSVVQGGPLQETWGGLNLGPEALPSVWVEDADVVRAEPIIAEYRQREKAGANRDNDAESANTRPKWVCAHCGYKVEEQFTQCWHCGHPRPANGPAIA